jgi:hypothetical protein
LKKTLTNFHLVLVVLLLWGCSSDNGKIDITNGKAVLISDGKDQAITFNVKLENNAKVDLESFFVEFDVQNEWLASKLEQKKFIVGEGIVGEKGKLFTLKSKNDTEIGGTMRLIQEIDDKQLKKVIEEEKGVKVNILDEENKVIKTNYLQNFHKE